MEPVVVTQQASLTFLNCSVSSHWTIHQTLRLYRDTKRTLIRDKRKKGGEKKQLQITELYLLFTFERMVQSPVKHSHSAATM